MTFERKTQDEASQSIVVEGNRKVGAGTIRSYFKAGPGGRLDAIEIDAGREALYATGLFQEVRTSQTGGTLTVTVVENAGADAEIMPQRSEARPPKRRKRASGARSTKPSARGYLDGQMLIAMPSMRDERFARTLIYICAHSSDGAMGIVVNQPAANISFPDLLVQLEVIPAADLIQLPSRAGVVKVLKGGPVETGRGFVLHSADFFIENSTLPIDDGVCLTATLDILKAIARGSGPASALLALGYAGWAPGQLEAEIQENGWLHCSADPELIFGTDTDGKYEKALRKLGVGPGMLSSEAGHA